MNVRAHRRLVVGASAPGRRTLRVFFGQALKKPLGAQGKGFHQPRKSRQHWHIDTAHVNIRGTFYYLCLERAREKFPAAKPGIISDNGPQFVTKSFKEYIRLCGMTHVRTAPYYPQSNGKLERWRKSLKTECIRPKTSLSLADAKRVAAQFVKCYNTG